MKNAVPALSLRTLIMVIVGALVAATLFFESIGLYQSYRSYQKATQVVERNRLADDSMRAVKNFAFERGRTNVVLRGEDPISAQNRQFVDARRAAADRYIEGLLARLPESFRTKGGDVQVAWDKVKGLRKAVDGDVPLARSDRDATLPRKWMEAANNLVARLESLLIAVSHIPGSDDVSFERLGDLRINVLQFRDQLGRVSSELGVEIHSGQAPREEVLSELRQMRSRYLQLWSQIERWAGQVEDFESADALVNARQMVFQRLRPLFDTLLDQASQGQVLPVTRDAYFEAAVAALDAVVELTDSISRETERHAAERLARARWSAFGLLLASLATLGLAAGIFWFLQRRFSRPMGEMLQRIGELTRREAGASPSRTALSGQGDEFSQVGYALDMLRESMQARHENERINKSILDSAPLSIVAADKEGLITVFSPGAAAMLGYSAEEVVGKHTTMLFHDASEVRARAEELSRELGRVVAPDFEVFLARPKQDRQAEKREWTYVRKDGSRLTVLLAVTVWINEQGEYEGAMGVATDITARVLAATELSRLAYHDPLTLLPNRRLFHDRIRMAISQSRREGGRLALLMIDLDKFKPVNDSFGHAAGDTLLKEAARRMQNCLRESDTLARLGGDEFLVLLPLIGDEVDAMTVADKIRLELCQPFALDGEHEAMIACSIGIAIYPDHGRDEKHLLANADSALYAAKENGRNCALWYSGVLPGRTPKEMEHRELPILQLVWRNAYRCGEASIDREHQDLFERSNRLIQSVVAPGGNDTRRLEAVDELISCVVSHFSNEETVLARCGYAGLEAHALQHRRLLVEARRLSGRAAAGELSLGEVVSFVALDVVVSHMLQEDRKFFPLLKQQGSPQLAGSAS